MKKYYKENGVELTDRPEAAADPSLLESALKNGLLPRDKFKRIYSTINLNGNLTNKINGHTLNGKVTRKDYMKAINEIQFQWDFNQCKLLFIYIGAHGVAGDQILFSDGRTVHYTDIIDQFRNKYTMMNKPIICLNNFCRPPFPKRSMAELPLHIKFINAKNKEKGILKSDAVEEFEVFDDRGPHHNRLHTVIFNATVYGGKAVRDEHGSIYLRKWIECWKSLHPSLEDHDMSKLHQRLLECYDRLGVQEVDDDYIDNLPEYLPNLKYSLKFPIHAALKEKLDFYKLY